MFVVVPEKTAEAAGLKYGARVRGTVNGVPYRSSLMKYGGAFHVGVHKATLAKAKASGGDRVEVTIEIDDEPLPTDTVPTDLARAFAKNAAVRDSWKKTSPSQKREYVKHVIEAKKPETRARRIAKILEALRHGPPPHKTWTPNT